MRGLDPRIYDELPKVCALRRFVLGARPHGLHRNSGLAEFAL